MPLNLRDKNAFPPFLALPDDPAYGHDPNYYDVDPDTDESLPFRHWCFLGEIVKDIDPPSKLSYTVRDVEGYEVEVRFNVRGREFKQVIAKCKPGSTLAVMYAEHRVYSNNYVGIELEELDWTVVLPQKLDEVLEIGDRLNDLSVCATCQQEAKLKCVQCKMPYCGKECQVSDWKVRHKRECTTAQALTRLGRLDFNVFDDYEYP
ncbi:hypothetical protein AX16_000646 [Volvariella volvacea WC 439]|nr:hypothetical protein AX16_000646 [Volvariella volvacea WC 439]